MLKASPILALCCPSWPTLSLPSYALSSPQPLYVPRCDVSSFAVREMSNFSCFLLSHPTFVLAVWHCWVVDVAGAGVPSPSHCLGYLGFISDALRLFSSPCPLWGGGERKWAGEVRGCLPCQAMAYPAGGTWLWRGGRVAGTSHLTIAPITAGGGWNSVCLAEPAACLECCLPPQQPLPASPSAGCVGCTRLGDEAGSLAQHPPSSHSRTRFACMLGGRGVPRGL